MIARVLTAVVPVAHSGRVHDLMRQQLPLLRAHDGLLYVKLARRMIDQREEIVLFEEWRDVDAMLVWTGADIARPRLMPGTEDLLDELHITHYEALDIEAPEMAAFVRAAGSDDADPPGDHDADVTTLTPPKRDGQVYGG